MVKSNKLCIDIEIKEYIQPTIKRIKSKRIISRTKIFY